MDNFTIQLTQANLQLVPVIIGIIQVIKQNDYLFNLLKNWLTLIGLVLGIVFVAMINNWVWSAETIFTGFTVGTLASGGYDVIKNLTPKLVNQKKADEVCVVEPVVISEPVVLTEPVITAKSKKTTTK
jgi:SNF family Na+-dependent transporter